jgi:hypothetical protein
MHPEVTHVQPGGVHPQSKGVHRINRCTPKSNGVHPEVKQKVYTAVYTHTSGVAVHASHSDAYLSA